MNDARETGEVNQLVVRWREGEREAGERLISLLYTELRQIARRQLASERAGHTLQPTALVNEAVLRLLGENRSHWRNRDQVVALAAQAMRRVLIDHARKRAADKRPDPQARVRMSLAQHEAHDEEIDVLALNSALETLARAEPRQAQIVELRYFGGLNLEEVAQALSLSLATVNRDWRVARASLRLSLQTSGAGPQ